MAKSLRSKWKRKMRAEKRKKNEPKELARLKRTLAMDGKAAMEDMQEVVTVVPAQKLKEKKEKKEEEEKKKKEGDVDMEGGAEVDGEQSCVDSIMQQRGCLKTTTTITTKIILSSRARRHPSALYWPDTTGAGVCYFGLSVMWCVWCVLGIVFLWTQTLFWSFYVVLLHVWTPQLLNMKRNSRCLAVKCIKTI